MVFNKCNKSNKLIALKKDQHQKLIEENSTNYEETKAIHPNTVQSNFNNKLNTIIKKYPGEANYELRKGLSKLTCSEPLSNCPLVPRVIVAELATKLSRFMAQ